MSTYILTSMFPNGFMGKAAEVFLEKIDKRHKFAFVASELIGLPLSAIERLEIAKSQINQLNLNDTIRQLTDAKTASQTYQILRRQLQDDSDNWKMLYC